VTDQTVKHYLVSLRVRDRYYMHAYLMSDDPDCINKVMPKIIYEAEQLGTRIGSIVLVAVLRNSLDVVRNMVANLGKEESDGLKTATNFHLNAWLMRDDDSLNKQLLAIHEDRLTASREVV
jgi:hypothetical protein